MHILVTDVLACPRCGPRFGLILLADRIDARRVVAGRLGCSNCRETYQIRDGTGWFGLPGSEPAAGGGATSASAGSGASAASAGSGASASAGSGESASAASAAPDEAVIRLAALLGLGEGSGPVLLAGDAAAQAPALAALLGGREVLPVNPPDGVRSLATGDDGDRHGVSVLHVTGDRLPLADAGMAGVAATGDAADAWLEECARLVAPLGRLLLEPAPDDAARRLDAAGMHVLAHEGDVLVAARKGVFR